jgi:superoxide dismutase, Cu-Zn family
MIQKKYKIQWLVAAIAAFLILSCDYRPGPVEEGGLSPENIARAVCVLHPTEGSNVSGIVTFTTTGSGVRIEARVEGLAPGKHGFHIHEFGDCSAADATSAGGHYNPHNRQHGGPEDEERHVGDLGNIEAGEDGTAHFEWEDELITLNGEYSVIGLSVVVHEDEDDLTSQPTGDAGGRLACGVIGIAEPE